MEWGVSDWKIAHEPCSSGSATLISMGVGTRCGEQKGRMEVAAWWGGCRGRIQYLLGMAGGEEREESERTELGAKEEKGEAGR